MQLKPGSKSTGARTVLLLSPDTKRFTAIKASDIADYEPSGAIPNNVRCRCVQNAGFRTQGTGASAATL